MSITSEQYEKLLDFSSFINKDYISFMKNVGYGMGLFFNYPLTVYTIFDRDYEGNTFIEYVEGHTVYPEGLMQYRESLWKSDLFVQRVTGIRQGSMQSPVITIPDIATYDEFYNTEYGQYLQRINTPYQAILRGMCGRLYPLHVLSVFKTKEQGDFTEQEKELLALIDRVFSKSVEHYLGYTSERFFWSFLQEETEYHDQKLAIVDDRGDVVFYNPEFNRLSSECFHVRGDSGIITHIREELKQQLNLDLFKLPGSCSIDVNDFTLRFSVHSYPWISRDQEFVFIRIDRKERSEETAARVHHEDQGLLQLVNTYGLTHREAEIADLLSRGMQNTEMAEYFHISLPTVKFHLQNVRRKMGVSSRAEMIALILESRS